MKSVSSDVPFDTGGLRRYDGTPTSPFLQRLLALLREEKDPQFTFLQRDPIPFRALSVPLGDARVALITTAGLHLRTERGFRVLEDVYGDPSYRVVPHGTPQANLDLEALYVDRKYTVDDPEVALPMNALAELAAAGRIGSVAPRHYSFCAGLVRPYPGLRTNVETLAAELHSDGVHAVVLLPTCSTCVQTVGLIAGELEERGVSTVGLTLLPELSEIVGVPRSLSVHFPYGAPCGDPFHTDLHRAVLNEALGLFEACDRPGLVVASKLQWRART